MDYQVKFSKKALAAYNELPNLVQRRIDQKLAYLRCTPRGADTIKLLGRDAIYRTRVGLYRILFEIDDAKHIIWLLDIGNRQEIYR